MHLSRICVCYEMCTYMHAFDIYYRICGLTTVVVYVEVSMLLTSAVAV